VSFDYVGSELELFANAIHWKRYFADQMRPFMGSRVLEVGAGIGGTTRVLCRGGEARWLCVEPDAALAQQVRALVDRGVLPRCCETRVGTLADLRDEAAFDTILYVDTLEHIEDDGTSSSGRPASSTAGDTSWSWPRRTNGCSRPSIAASVIIAATPDGAWRRSGRGRWSW
jgi:Methyltransferase domain